MAKTAKPKKREISQHSRAARRAASPSLNLDKSLTSKPSRTSPAPASLSHTLTQPSGITKKSKKGTAMTRAQRLRHQRGLEKAEEVLDKRQVKVGKSLGKEKVVKERSKTWDDVNAGGARKKAAKNGVNGFEALEEEEQKREARTWGDEEMEDGGEVEVAEGEVKGDGKAVDGAAANVPLPVEEDELL